MPTKVLIADDSLKVQKELTGILKEAGIEVVAVSNGEHAVRKLAAVQPDLVLADIFMPVRSGYEVCEYIKTSEEFSHVAVVLLANKMEPYDEAEAKRVRADGKVEKPITDPAAVLAAVQQYLEKAAAQKPAPPPPPIEEFAQAVPSAEPEPEPEPEQLSTRPPPVTFDTQAPMGFTDVEEEPAPAAPAEPPVDPSEATTLTPAKELKEPLAEESPEAPAPPEAPPAAEEIAQAEEAPPSAPAKVEKPEVAAPWEMTGPEPGAPEIPAAGGWHSQWSGTEEQAAAEAEPAAEAPPAEEAPAAPAAEHRYEPEEFAAAFTPPSGAAPAEPSPPAPAPAAAELDPAVVDQVVNQVLERLSPQVMDTIAREIVRPLAENLLKEKFQK